MTLLAERIKYVNPVLLNEAGQGVVDAVARLLEYERFHDRLEMIKMKDRTLPAVIEQRVGRSIHGTVVDAQAMSRLLKALTEELDEVGVMEALIPSLADIEPATVPELLKERSQALEDWLEQHGMARELWRWAFQYAQWDDIAFTAEGGAIVVLGGGRRIGVITGSRAPALDAASFVTQAVGLPPRYRKSAGSRTAPGFSPAAIVDMAMREVEAFYELRAARTATEGVQVLPTGIPVIIIFLIIAAVILIIGIVLSALCGNGVITDKNTCALASYFILVGFLGLFAVTGGGLADQSGESDPDPEG